MHTVYRRAAGHTLWPQTSFELECWLIVLLH